MDKTIGYFYPATDHNIMAALRGGMSPSAWKTMSAHANYHAHQPSTGVCGGGDRQVQQALAGMRRAPRGGNALGNALGTAPRFASGALTFSKTQAQGNMASYGSLVMGGGSPLQDIPQGRDALRATHHVDARMFGKVSANAGPPPISRARMLVLGQLDQKCTQAEVVVNRLTRECRDAEKNRNMGRLRPRLLRAGAAAESTVYGAMQEVEHSGMGVENLPHRSREGLSEAQIVDMFKSRLGAALNKLTTLGLQNSAAQIKGAEQIKGAQKQTIPYPTSRKNNINLSGEYRAMDSTLVPQKLKGPNVGHQQRNFNDAGGAYGRFDRPQILVSALAHLPTN